MFGVSRDYQNPSLLLTFAYLGSLNRVTDLIFPPVEHR